jgi:transglutaminase-like putative cysteine protease
MNRKRWIIYIRLGLMLLLACAPLAACGTPASTPQAPTARPTTTSLPPVLISPTATSTPPAGSIEFKNPKNYRVEYIVTVHNKGFTLNKLMVYQARPIEWDGQKNVAVEEVSPSPFKSGMDPVFGNGIYYWQILGEPKPGDSIQFKIQFTFTAYEISTTVDPDKIQPYHQDDPLYKLYTRPERFIESTDPQIVALADQLADGETNPYRLARKFYDYVIATAHYRLLGKGLLGAKSLLRNGEGECGDYSSLFIALSRAKGIPSRPVVGYWAVSGINQTHVWAEFYIEEIGWIPVDPTFGQTLPGIPGKPDYYFGNMDNQRVILNKGFNLQLDPVGPDNYSAPFLQVPIWWYWGSSGDASTVSIERTSWKVTLIQ